MTDVALTTIHYGTDEGEVLVFEPGDSVSEIPTDVLENLKEQGAVGEPPVTKAQADSEKDELKAQVADLKAQLAEARAAKPEAPKGPQAPTK
jgi:hypothetical protein